MRYKQDLLRALNELDFPTDVLCLEGLLLDTDELIHHTMIHTKEETENLINEFFPNEELVGGRIGAFRNIEITGWHYKPISEALGK